MPPQGPYDTPGEATAVDGEVVQKGPGPVGVAMTPSTARVTGQRLQDAADDADLTSATPTSMTSTDGPDETGQSS